MMEPSPFFKLMVFLLQGEKMDLQLGMDVNHSVFSTVGCAEVHSHGLFCQLQVMVPKTFKTVQRYSLDKGFIFKICVNGGSLTLFHSSARQMTPSQHAEAWPGVVTVSWGTHKHRGPSCSGLGPVAHPSPFFRTSSWSRPSLNVHFQ